jgi:hypothetical protein
VHYYLAGGVIFGEPFSEFWCRQWWGLFSLLRVSDHFDGVFFYFIFSFLVVCILDVETSSSQYVVAEAGCN